MAFNHPWIRRGFSWLLVLLICSGGMFRTAAAVDTEADQWSRRAAEVQERVREGDLIGAREALSELARRFSQTDLEGRNLSVEGIHALSESLIETDRQLNRITPYPKPLHSAAVRLRLAFDAVSHSHQPLWHQYHSLLQRDLSSIRKALKKNRIAAVRQGVDSLSGHYRDIEPALFVARSPTAVERVRSLMTFIRRQAGEGGNRQALAEGISRMEAVLHPLFFGSEEELIAALDDSPPLFPILFSVGGVIAMALSYVGWRKYRGMPDPVRRPGR